MAVDSEQPAKKPRLYVVATSHLDTQWRWTIQTTIRHFLRRTLLDNFKRIRESPYYVLSFEGAFRYQLAEEYYPKEFQELLQLVREKRWLPAGAMLDAPDTNLPSPESLIRHVLYGNDYFESKFGRRCEDIFLPDCFGFPWSLPTVAAHCGIKGFSSQKLGNWRAPAEIPFDIGLWEGPDGSRIVAVLQPGGYGSPLRSDLSRAKAVSKGSPDRLTLGDVAGYKYFGVGDRGGAPDRTSLDYLDLSLSGEGDIEVIHAGSDQFFRDLSAEDRERLPVHCGDLLLPTHGTGCWTAQAVLKKWNRRCELLAEAAERAALAADWLGGQPYPGPELRQEWTRFLWHQMHDDLTGTSSPEAYRFTSNDLLLTQNRLSTFLHSSTSSVARGLDTRSEGVPLVIYNALGFEREELVEAWVRFDGEVPQAVTLVDPAGSLVACQELERDENRLRLLFPAKVPSVGFSVYQVLSAGIDSTADSSLRVTQESLENWRYRVQIDANGAVASLYDKLLEQELLRRPMEVALLPDHSARWPAWELRYEDICSPEAVLPAPSAIRIAEVGPVRVALEIERRDGPTTLRQKLSLSVGAAGSRLEVHCDVQWRSAGKLLKAVFPLALEEAVATYDMGLGAIQRGINTRKQYEVPAHEWADLSGTDWGVSIFSRDKYGWDRPRADTLRLSLLRSPKALRRFAHQAAQDFGHHRIDYAVQAHPAGAIADIAARAASFNQPLFPFQAAGHPGDLGRQFSLLTIRGEGAHLMALKKSEKSERWLARIRETAGANSTRFELSGPQPFAEAVSANGCEQEKGSVELVGGNLQMRLPRFGPASVLLNPGTPAHRLEPLEQEPVALSFETIATSFHGQGSADFDGNGHSIPGELFPPSLHAGELDFTLGPNVPGEPNALTCRGQELDLPAGDFDRLTLLVASTHRAGTRIGLSGETEASLWVPYYSGFVGQRRLFSGRLGYLMQRWKPGFIERTPVAWVGTHRHDHRVRDQAYTFCYLFLVELSIAPGSDTATLPDSPDVKLFGATASQGRKWLLEPAALFYD